MSSDYFVTSLPDRSWINQRYYRATDSISLAGIGKMPELPTPLLPCLGSMVHALPVNHRSTTIFSCSPSNGLSR